MLAQRNDGGEHGGGSADAARQPHGARYVSGGRRGAVTEGGPRFGVPVVRVGAAE
jgi:hypothetical protein